jgi:hypothetical protein
MGGIPHCRCQKAGRKHVIGGIGLGDVPCGMYQKSQLCDQSLNTVCL